MGSLQVPDAREGQVVQPNLFHVILPKLSRFKLRLIFTGVYGNK